MDALASLARLTRVEAIKYWRRPVARLVLVIMFVGPIAGEAILAGFSIRDATYPQITQFLFSADMLMMIALMTVVVSVMALGNDYDIGTVRAILNRGVERYQFILSKILATVGAAFVYGLVFIATAFLSTYVVHVLYSEVPFLEAAGRDILWRLILSTGVIGLDNFVLSGVVMLALVLSRSSWGGMLAGLGYFFGDIIVGGLGSGSVLGMDTAYRYTLAYHAISITEHLFPSDPTVSLPRAWIAGGFAGPGGAVLALLLYGAALTAISILVFRRQDLVAKH